MNTVWQIYVHRHREKNFLRMFIFEQTKLNQTQFEQRAQFLLQYKHCYATSKFDVWKIKIELNLPLKETVENNKLLVYPYS